MEIAKIRILAGNTENGPMYRKHLPEKGDGTKKTGAVIPTAPIQNIYMQIIDFLAGGRPSGRPVSFFFFL